MNLHSTAPARIPLWRAHIICKSKLSINGSKADEADGRRYCVEHLPLGSNERGDLLKMLTMDRLIYLTKIHTS
jgi:hypothetical protein